VVSYSRRFGYFLIILVASAMAGLCYALHRRMEA
jgi:hypothetical protein